MLRGKGLCWVCRGLVQSLASLRPLKISSREQNKMLLHVKACGARCRIILLPPWGNVMVSWPHFVKDKDSLIDKAISTFPRSQKPQGWTTSPCLRTVVRNWQWGSPPKQT